MTYSCGEPPKRATLLLFEESKISSLSCGPLLILVETLGSCSKRPANIAESFMLCSSTDIKSYFPSVFEAIHSEPRLEEAFLSGCNLISS